jgi:DNA-binding SARP family transcriptional activator
VGAEEDTAVDVTVELADAPPADAEVPVSTWSGSKRIQQLRAAPLRVRCFGAREVWYGDEQIWPDPRAVEDTGWELLLILAVHPIAGVQTDRLIDILWPERAPKDPAGTLRKRRFRLRKELSLLVPDLKGEPLPTDPDGRVHRLDPAVIASDVQLFLELVECARTLPPADAIAAYEEALALYRGDLLECMDMPNYWWLYHGAALAIGLRSDYRHQQWEARLRLAELRAAGPDVGLARAEELYAGLTAEDPLNEPLWVALFRVHGRRGDPIGLEASVRRLRSALVELGRAASPDTVVLSTDLENVLNEVRTDLRRRTSRAVA